MYKKIYVEITNNCNLSCNFCIKNKREKKYMELDNFKIILNKLENKTKYLYFHILGEPLIHPLINDFINIGSNNFKINITTNGYYINRVKENKNIWQMNISLHSFNPKYNVSLNDYMNNIFESIDLLQNYTYINFRFWVDNEYNKEMLNLINKRYNSNIELEEIKNKKINVRLCVSTSDYFIWPDLNNNYYSEEGKCLGSIDHVGILVDGTVVPCCLDSKGDINLGNIYEDELLNITKGNRCNNMIQGFRKNEKREELCKHCKFL